MLFQERIIKKNQRKNNFKLVKNILVIQSLSASWCSGSLMEMKIQNFQIRLENREKYFRNQIKIFQNKSVDRLIVVHQIQIFWRSCQKVGKIQYCRIVVEAACFKEMMAVDELFRSNQEKIKPTLLYSRRWHMKFGLLKRWRWRPTSFLFRKVSEIMY